MPLCPSLRHVESNPVVFDPTNPEHLKAFEMLCLGEAGNIRQHPTLRFDLEENFPDVRSLMFHKVGRYHVKTTGNK